MRALPSLVGKTAAITGATGGIGFAIATRFAQEGASVVLLGRSKAKLERALGEIQSDRDQHRQKFSSAVLDVANFEQWKDVAKEHDKIDILVNCAGITQKSLLVKTEPSEVMDIVNTNLTGAIWGCKAVGKPMLRRKSGCIINVSSLLAVKAHFGTAIYGATKAALLGLTGTLAIEYGHFGVRVNAIVPGYISTLMTNDILKRAIPLHRFGLPHEIADAAVFLANNTYTNNCILNVDGGLSAG
ncbi:hypothetical protein B0T26DRAFT_744068 [Lasiosphaeria miniovina]|uniref:Uncharacterized protein n=1 Tax=Lasiosphaeria miniovina TaxID=1954250 RepID=A0AA40A0E1_9PEZI|nr:uncharacterized protein B0T26DRAFT_744068 [Lasiosphaeria miniovina]KAK0706996.1 hypothetical protein B0T26DRAFT_744068 [Lasiosphaeria miniovina]